MTPFKSCIISWTFDTQWPFLLSSFKSLHLSSPRRGGEHSWLYFIKPNMLPHFFPFFNHLHPSSWSHPPFLFPQSWPPPFTEYNPSFNPTSDYCPFWRGWSWCIIIAPSSVTPFWILVFIPHLDICQIHLSFIFHLRGFTQILPLHHLIVFLFHREKLLPHKPLVWLWLKNSSSPASICILSWPSLLPLY